MLYYLDRPEEALIEAARVLRTGGIFVACTSSRYNDPEIASVLGGPECGDVRRPTYLTYSSPSF